MISKVAKDVHFYYSAFNRLEIMTRAAALSFYTVISIFPLALLFTASLGYFLPMEKFLSASLGFLDDFLPFHVEFLTTNLRTLFVKRAGISWFGLISVFFSAQMLYLNMEKAINAILHVESKRRFLSSRLMFFAWFIGMILVLFSPLFFEIMGSIAKSLGWHVLLFGFLSALSSKGGFTLAGFLMFCLVMLVLPVKRIAMRRVFYGGFLFAVTLQIGKIVFKWAALNNMGRYNLVYGSLASIIIGLLWIFYFYALFLFFVYWAGRPETAVTVK